MAALAPPNPISGPVPDGFADRFRAVVVGGQLGLWFVLASAHAWLLRRDEASAGEDREVEGEGAGPVTSG